jgi:sphingolipid delta-4 desaturase
MTVNKIMAVLCNIPMTIPSALSFGKYHSDHHNFLGEKNEDPDLPLLWESNMSAKFKWYKYVFYSIIELFYALRPVFMKNPTLTRDEALNYLFIAFTNYAIYHFWGPWALLFFFIAGLSSIGPHPAAIHIIAEHYEFIEGQETYDYIGIWNFFNLDLGYHLEHHDFPNAPWYNLRKIRAIAPEFYEYLPHHTSYWKVLKKFLTDANWNLFYRTIRIPPKNE